MIGGNAKEVNHEGSRIMEGFETWAIVLKWSQGP